MPGHERLVAEQVLQLARVLAGCAPARPRASAPGRARRGPSRPGPGPATGARRPRAAGRPCPSGSGRGSARSRGASSPGSHGAPARPARRRPRAGRRSAAPNASSTAVPDGGFSPRAASWKRPVSIGLTTTRSRSRSSRGTCPARAIARDALPGERLELRRRAADGSGIGARARRDGPARQGGVEGVGDDVEVGQLGHGRRLYPRKRAC